MRMSFASGTNTNTDLTDVGRRSDIESDPVTMDQSVG